jgi:hypothetical protein
MGGFQTCPYGLRVNLGGHRGLPLHLFVPYLVEERIEVRKLKNTLTLTLSLKGRGN